MRVRHLVVFSLSFLLSAAHSYLSAQHTVSEHSVIAKSDTPGTAAAWSLDGSHFATTWNNSVIVWNAETNAIDMVFSDHAGPVKTVRFSPDGSWLREPQSL